MIINRALIREVLVTAGAVALVISAIFLVLRSVGFLREAASGMLPVESVLVLVLLKMVTYMDVIIPLILFVAILMVFGRWQRDNEMTVIAACGIGLPSLLKPMAVLFVIVGGAVAAFSLYLSPLATRVAENIRFDYQNRAEVSGVLTGSFMETRRGRGVYFVERYNEARDSYENVFVYNAAFEKDGVVVASRAKRQIDERTGAQFLVLQDGIRYEGKAGSPDYRVVEFSNYAVRLKERAQTAPTLPIKGWPTTRIIGAKNPRLITEWHWRIAKPISIGVLILFAISFSSTDVRNRRIVNLLAAFLIYFAYSNAMGVVVALMKNGEVNPRYGLWLVHASFAALAIWVFMRRAKGLQLFELPRLRRKARAAAG